MVIAPLLIELGLHPLVAAATSSLMVLFSASTAALAFAFDHLLSVTYALVFGIGARRQTKPRAWTAPSPGRPQRHSARLLHMPLGHQPIVDTQDG